MKSYRIVIEYTEASDFPRNHPILWDWHDLTAADMDEAVSVVNVEEIETPEGHKEELNNI
jgi:hypothetical protein